MGYVEKSNILVRSMPKSCRSVYIVYLRDFYGGPAAEWERRRYRLTAWQCWQVCPVNTTVANNGCTDQGMYDNGISTNGDSEGFQAPPYAVHSVSWA